MAVTLEDVAKKAGVSHTTVSLVLHGDKKISAVTKQKVMRIIEEMNYHPNYYAQSLANGKTNTIAVLISFYSSLFATDIMKGIEDESMYSAYSINQYSTRGDKDLEKEQMEKILYGKRADGLIVISLQPDMKIMEDYKAAGLPIILIERKNVGFSSVVANNEKGAYLAASHLIKSGRKNMAIASGRLDCFDCINAEERFNGFNKALNEAGMKFDDNNFFPTWYEFEDGVRIMSGIAEKKMKIDALFCSSGDNVALGAMKEAKKRGIKIPDDIAIIGYDDILVASMLQPALTTVRQPIVQMGREAYNLMCKSLNNEIKEPVVTVFEPELIVRESA
jgi:LacI family transcriptional regulator